MTGPYSKKTSCLFLLAATGAVLVLLVLFTNCPTHAQAPAPRITVDDECTAIAYAPDGRLAYATKHIFTVQKLEVQRDDVWIMEPDGKRHRIINGEKLARGDEAFGYTIIGLRWSVDGKRISADISTSQLSSSGDTLRDQMLMLVGQDGKEIKIVAGDNLVTGTLGGAWLGTEDTLAFLTETAKPKLMFSISLIQAPGGRVQPLFDRRSFAAVSWNARLGNAVAVERNLTGGGDARLVELDLLKEDYRLLAKLDGYFGALSISPSGSKVAYFRDSDVIEIRDIADPQRVARVRVDYGNIAWAPDEQRLMVKRGLDRQEGDVVWVPLPPFSAATADSANIPVSEPSLTPLLNGQTFRDFALAPDGHSVAVLTLPKRTLEIFDLQ